MTSQAVEVIALEWEPDADAVAALGSIASAWPAERRADYLGQFPSLPAWLAAMGPLAEREVARVATEHFPAGARVLDVGAGSGRSTLLLRQHGFAPVPVEPVPEMCALIGEACDRFGEPRPQIICGPAEALDQLLPADASTFDAALFNSSFHHLTDPVLALRNVRALLRPGSAVAVVNEPHRPFFAQKARLRPRLLGEPADVCSFAGKEQAFLPRDYVRMLRDGGFLAIETEINVRETDYSLALRELADRGRDGALTNRQMAVRAVAFGAVTELCRNARAGKMLQRSGMVMSTYVGYVPR